MSHIYLNISRIRIDRIGWIKYHIKDNLNTYKFWKKEKTSKKNFGTFAKLAIISILLKNEIRKW